MIRISCKNERFTYDMYHIVKSFLPDAEIQPEGRSRTGTSDRDDRRRGTDLEEQACDKRSGGPFFIAGRLNSQTSAKKENKSVISIKNYIRPWSKRPEKNMHGGI